MRNLVSSGETVTTVAPRAVPSGGGLQIGDLFGIAGTAAATGGRVVMHTEGVYLLPKASALALTVGQTVAWSESDQAVHAPASGLLRIGQAVEVAPAGTVAVKVRLACHTSGPDA